MKGRNFIRTIGPTLQYSRDATEDAVKLYERVYEGDVKGLQEDRRQAMCVACLHVVGKMNNYGVLIRNLGRQLSMPNPYRKFGQALSILKTKYDVTLPENNVMRDTFNMLTQKSIPGGVILLVQQLIPLFDRSWILSGRSLKPIICVAAYYAWKAKDFYKRRKVSYANFCAMFGLTKYKERKAEISALLQAMAREIPWVVAEQEKDLDVSPYLKDIIRYKNLLFDSALKTTVQKMKLEYENNETSESMAEIERKEKCETVFKRELRWINPKRNPEGESEILGEIESLPKRPKCESKDIFENSVITKNEDEEEVVDDLDLDKDIDQYIRSEKEVRELEALYSMTEPVKPEEPVKAERKAS